MQEDTATLDHSANWGHPYNCPKKKGELKTERSTSCEEREFYGLHKPGSSPKLRIDNLIEIHWRAAKSGSE